MNERTPQEPGAEIEATVMVTSTYGFTARSQEFSPEKLAAWANRHFARLTEVVLSYGGVPVKYVGDGFLAYFTADDHRTRSLRAAITARDSTEESVVVGLATGSVYVTEIGVGEFARPDILGSTVNLAFRVNAWAMTNAPARIATALEEGAEVSPRFLTGKSEGVALKGFARPVRIVEVLGMAMGT